MLALYTTCRGLAAQKMAIARQDRQLLFHSSPWPGRAVDETLRAAILEIEDSNVEIGIGRDQHTLPTDDRPAARAFRLQ